MGQFETWVPIFNYVPEIQPNMRGWLLACVDGKKPGIVPANYIKVLGKRSGSQSASVVQQKPAPTTGPADRVEYDQLYSQPEVPPLMSRSDTQTSSSAESVTTADPKPEQNIIILYFR